MTNPPPLLDAADHTIAEIHKIRAQIADKFHGDIAAIIADARQHQLASGCQTLSLASMPTSQTSNPSITTTPAEPPR